VSFVCFVVSLLYYPMRKPRSDSKLDTKLSEEQKCQLAEALLSGLPYHAAKKKCKEEFKVSTSFAALSNFWETYCAAALLARRRRAVTTADEIAEEALQTPGKFDAATIDALKQKAFELSVNPGANPRDIKQLFSLVLKSRDQDLKTRDIEIKLRRLELLEEQRDHARQSLEKVKEGGGLSDKAIKEIERTLGMLS